MHTATYYPEVTPDFGHWLAGFIDGEGCFLIRRIPRPGYFAYQPRITLALRADDEPVLAMIKKRLGLGHIHGRGSAAANGNPQVCWLVDSKVDCSHMVTVFDRYPLRSKKARDYALWREAVLLWAPMRLRSTRRGGIRYDWAPIADLHARIVAGRAYSEA